MSASLCQRKMSESSQKKVPLRQGESTTIKNYYQFYESKRESQLILLTKVEQN